MFNKENGSQLTDSQSYQKNILQNQIGKAFQTSYTYLVWMIKL